MSRRRPSPELRKHIDAVEAALANAEAKQGVSAAAQASA
jgi:hypothetical protein